MLASGSCATRVTGTAAGIAGGGSLGAWGGGLAGGSIGGAVGGIGGAIFCSSGTGGSGGGPKPSPKFKSGPCSGGQIGGTDPYNINVSARWDNAGPYDALWDWMWGTYPTQTFNENDPFTQQLMQSSHVTYFLSTLRDQFNHCGVPASSGRFDRNLGDYNKLQRALIYAKDGLNVATGGLTGNVAQSVLGSYGLDYSLTNVNLDTGKATVNIVVTNTWTFGSATRNPMGGDSPGYQPNQRPNWLPPGAMEPSTQLFSWSTTLGFNNTGCVY